MSNPAVVILTDPARCQLAEAETLMQALEQLTEEYERARHDPDAEADHGARIATDEQGSGLGTGGERSVRARGLVLEVRPLRCVARL
jgi:hypothetical protein